MTKPNGGMTFDKALKGFVTANKNTQKYARICAEMGIQHFEKTGDLVYCQNFLDAMTVNWNRKAAFVKWLCAHAPVKLESNKLLKDKGAKAVKFDVETACATPFWEFAPDLEVITFDGKDFMKAVQSLIKRFENKDRTVPASESVIVFLDHFKKKVAELVPEADKAVANKPKAEGNTPLPPAPPAPAVVNG